MHLAPMFVEWAGGTEGADRLALCKWTSPNSVSAPSYNSVGDAGLFSPITVSGNDRCSTLRYSVSCPCSSSPRPL